MAALVFELQTSEIALSAATEMTVLQVVAPANHRLKLLAWGIYFNGTAAAAVPPTVQLLRQTTAGTSGDPLTPRKTDDSIAESIQSTALQQIDGTQPTAGDILKVPLVHPQFGYEYTSPPYDQVIVGGGDRLGIAVTAAAAVSVRAYMKLEE